MSSGEHGPPPSGAGSILQPGARARPHRAARRRQDPPRRGVQLHAEPGPGPAGPPALPHRDAPARVLLLVPRPTAGWHPGPVHGARAHAPGLEPPASTSWLAWSGRTNGGLAAPRSSAARSSSGAALIVRSWLARSRRPEQSCPPKPPASRPRCSPPAAWPRRCARGTRPQIPGSGDRRCRR